jgi:hypothetical protein
MTIQKTNYSVEHTGPLETLLQRDFMGFYGKYFIGKELGLTGSEVSLNRLPAGKGIPFVHAHKLNEELYIVLCGNGIFYVDSEEIPVQEGSLIRVAPAGERALRRGVKICTLSVSRRRQAASPRPRLRTAFVSRLRPHGLHRNKGSYEKLR